MSSRGFVAPKTFEWNHGSSARPASERSGEEDRRRQNQDGRSDLTPSPYQARQQRDGGTNRTHNRPQQSGSGTKRTQNQNAEAAHSKRVRDEREGGQQRRGSQFEENSPRQSEQQQRVGRQTAQDRPQERDQQRPGRPFEDGFQRRDQERMGRQPAKDPSGQREQRRMDRQFDQNASFTRDQALSRQAEDVFHERGQQRSGRHFMQDASPQRNQERIGTQSAEKESLQRSRQRRLPTEHITQKRCPDLERTEQLGISLEKHKEPDEASDMSVSSTESQNQEEKFQMTEEEFKDEMLRRLSEVLSRNSSAQEREEQIAINIREMAKLSPTLFRRFMANNGEHLKSMTRTLAEQQQCQDEEKRAGHPGLPPGHLPSNRLPPDHFSPAHLPKDRLPQTRLPAGDLPPPPLPPPSLFRLQTDPLSAGHLPRDHDLPMDHLHLRNQLSQEHLTGRVLPDYLPQERLPPGHPPFDYPPFDHPPHERLPAGRLPLDHLLRERLPPGYLLPDHVPRERLPPGYLLPDHVPQERLPPRRLSPDHFPQERLPLGHSLDHLPQERLPPSHLPPVHLPNSPRPVSPQNPHAPEHTISVDQLDLLIHALRSGNVQYGEERSLQERDMARSSSPPRELKKQKLSDFFRVEDVREVDSRRQESDSRRQENDSGDMRRPPLDLPSEFSSNEEKEKKLQELLTLVKKGNTVSDSGREVRAEPSPERGRENNQRSRPDLLDRRDRQQRYQVSEQRSSSSSRRRSRSPAALRSNKDSDKRRGSSSPRRRSRSPSAPKSNKDRGKRRGSLSPKRRSRSPAVPKSDKYGDKRRGSHLSRRRSRSVSPEPARKKPRRSRSVSPEPTRKKPRTSMAKGTEEKQEMPEKREPGCELRKKAKMLVSLQLELDRLVKEKDEWLKSQKNRNAEKYDPEVPTPSVSQAMENTKRRLDISMSVAMEKNTKRQLEISQQMKAVREEMSSITKLSVKSPGNEEKKKNYALNCCKRCNVLFTNISDFVVHLASYTHLQNQRSSNHLWEKEAMKKYKNSASAAEEKNRPVKGVEMMAATIALFCPLCSELCHDTKVAEAHLKSEEHFNKYQEYVANHPFYEHQYLQECWDRKQTTRKIGVPGDSDRQRDDNAGTTSRGQKARGKTSISTQELIDLTCASPTHSDDENGSRSPLKSVNSQQKERSSKTTATSTETNSQTAAVTATVSSEPQPQPNSSFSMDVQKSVDSSESKSVSVLESNQLGSDAAAKTTTEAIDQTTPEAAVTAAQTPPKVVETAQTTPEVEQKTATGTAGGKTASKSPSEPTPTKPPQKTSGHVTQRRTKPTSVMTKSLPKVEAKQAAQPVSSSSSTGSTLPAKTDEEALKLMPPPTSIPLHKKSPAAAKPAAPSGTPRHPPKQAIGPTTPEPTSTTAMPKSVTEAASEPATTAMSKLTPMAATSSSEPRPTTTVSEIETSGAASKAAFTTATSKSTSALPKLTSTTAASKSTAASPKRTPTTASPKPASTTAASKSSPTTASPKPKPTTASAKPAPITASPEPESSDKDEAAPLLPESPAVSSSVKQLSVTRPSTPYTTKSAPARGQRQQQTRASARSSTRMQNRTSEESSSMSTKSPGKKS